MIRHRRYRPSRGGVRRGISLVEVTIAMLLVALMLSAAVRSVGVARVTEYRMSLQFRGKLLAQSLMAEILQKAYRDPTSPTAATLGPDLSNLETSRAIFNDVDDYTGWNESPPKNADGTTIAPDLAAWSRSVKVESVDPANLTGPASAAETGAKRITVSVSCSGSVVAAITAIRTNAP
jgi:MSHA pilin protein MshD